MKKGAEKTSTDLKKLRSRIAKAPQKPGVYRWLDSEGTILYVGKAKNVRNRLRSYVQKPGKSAGPWKLALLRTMTNVDWTITSNELEALILETNLIKEHRPKYNVLMKDDKNYMYVKITTQDLYPRVEITRRMEEDKALYFGPFVSSSDLRDTLDLLHTVFEFRACARSLDALNRSKNAELKECLEHQIGKCNGLCMGKITREDYAKRIEHIIRFFRGDHDEVKVHLREMMQEAAEQKKFEKAAKLRNTLTHIQSLDEQQIVSGTSGSNTDVFGVALLRERAHVVLLQERGGKVVNELSFTLAGNAETAGDVLTQFLPQYYSSTQDIPDMILIPRFSSSDPALSAESAGESRRLSRAKTRSLSTRPQGSLEENIEDEIATISAWLTQRKGSRVEIMFPKRGKKSKLLSMAQKNAEEKIEQQFAKWEAETLKVERALQELKKALHLKNIPKRIECYDISHLGGTETVGSMVTAIDGKPRSDHYRSFTLRTIKKGEIDDYKSLREVLARRLRYLMNTEEKWRERGVVFGKARKNEQQTLEEIVQEHPSDLNDPDVDYRRYFVARKENEIIACGTLKEHKGAIRELTSIWVADPWRGQRFGHLIVRKILRSVKGGKVYLMVHPKLEQYYVELGFRYIPGGPKLLEEDLQAFLKRHPEEEGILMMHEINKNKPDPSLTTKPDLLLLDGGKGQLNVGVEVLKRMNLAIPVISLAKREEEVFVPGKNAALEIGEEAQFLLMRLRDEAHRFANRHRERRAKHALLS